MTIICVCTAGLSADCLACFCTIWTRDNCEDAFIAKCQHRMCGCGELAFSNDT